MRFVLLLAYVAAARGAQNRYSYLESLGKHISSYQTEVAAIPAALDAYPLDLSTQARAATSIRSRGEALQKAVASCQRLEQALADAETLLATIVTDPPKPSLAPMVGLRRRLMDDLERDYTAARQTTSPGERRMLAGAIRRVLDLVHWTEIEGAEQKTRHLEELHADKPRLTKIQMNLATSFVRVKDLREQLEFALSVNRKAEQLLSARRRGFALTAVPPIPLRGN